MDKKLNKKQRSALTQFIEFTALGNKKLAINILQDVGWKVDQAVEVIFSAFFIHFRSFTLIMQAR